MRYVFLSVLLALTCALYAAPSHAQIRFTGMYIVVADTVTATSQDSAVPHQKFRYGDSVRVTARPNLREWGIKYGSNTYFIPRTAVVTARQFEEGVELRSSTALGQCVVIVDSARCDIDGNALWVRKGTTLNVIGEPDSLSYLVEVYGKSTTIKRSDVVKIVSTLTQAQQELSTDGKRKHNIRLGLSVGLCMPLIYASYLDPGFSYQIGADILLNGKNLHLTVGYESNTLHGSLNDAKGTFGSLNAGILLGLGSGIKPVVPFVRLGFALLTDGSYDAMILTGVGVDFYASSKAVVFAELTPTIEIQPFDFIWIPIRVGARVAF